jgi:hypothetical protein
MHLKPAPGSGRLLVSVGRLRPRALFAGVASVSSGAFLQTPGLRFGGRFR